MSNEVLKPLVESEGYCCIRGYLRLCASRKETPEGMAKHMGVAVSTIQYNYERLRTGKRTHQCQQSPDCMRALFESTDPPL